MTWEAGWRYGIISTVPHEQQKLTDKILIILSQRIYYYLSISLTCLPCHREPSILFMSMYIYIFFLSDTTQQNLMVMHDGEKKQLLCLYLKHVVNRKHATFIPFRSFFRQEKKINLRTFYNVALRETMQILRE